MLSESTDDYSTRVDASKKLFYLSNQSGINLEHDRLTFQIKNWNVWVTEQEFSMGILRMFKIKLGLKRVFDQGKLSYGQRRGQELVKERWKCSILKSTA